MPHRTVIATAGNVLPSALATLRALGYTVTFTSSGRLCQAENAVNRFVAEDPLLLLALVKLHEHRGSGWPPTDSEVEDYLSFDAARQAAVPDREVRVWEDQGAVHVLCVSAFGDPVELSTHEARSFASQLAAAISKAE